MTDHEQHDIGLIASQLVLACLACRETEPTFEANRQTFGLMLDGALIAVDHCRACLLSLLGDLCWIAAQWATPEQETDLAESLARALDAR